MKTLIALIVLLPTLAMAKDSKRTLMESKLHQRLTELQSLINTYDLHEMTDEDIVGVINKLEELKKITKGSQKNSPYVTCSKNSNPEEIKEAKTKINEFSRSLVGMRYDLIEAREYTNYWLENYSCEAADSFIKDFKNIETFASMGYTETQGLHYVNEESVDYAKNMVRFYCTGTNLPKIFKNHFLKAQSIGYTKKQARDYAQLRTEEEAFICKR